MLSRRRLLLVGGGVVADLSLSLTGARGHGAAARNTRSPRLQKFVDPLPRPGPALKPGGTHQGSPLYEIAMRPIRQRLHRDLPPTPLWAYAGRYPGPTIEARAGQRIFVRWSNEIPDGQFLLPQAFDAHLHGTHHGEPPTKTVVHLHGAVVAPDSDGRPDAWFTHGFAQNASNARFHNLRLADGRTFVQIGTDQGLLPAPVEARRILLAPAERADVIVDFRGARGAIRLLNDAPTPYPNGKAPDRSTTANIMEFRVSKRLARPDTARIPNKLRAVAPLSEHEAKVRYMAFREYMDTQGEIAIVLLNGRKWDAPVTIQCKAGETEVWHLINPTEDSHPIHLHLVRFQVLGRQKFDSDDYLKAWNAEIPGEGPDPVPVEPYLRGSRIPPPAQERGWKDTVRVDPGEVVRIMRASRVFPENIRGTAMSSNMKTMK